MLEKIDCDMDPLLSMTNKMMGGVILDFTACQDTYGFSIWDICNYQQRSRVPSIDFPSYKSGMSTQIILSHCLESDSWYPTYQWSYLFSQQSPAMFALRKLIRALGAEHHLSIIDLNRVDGFSCLFVSFYIEEVRCRYQHSINIIIGLIVII